MNKKSELIRNVKTVTKKKTWSNYTECSSLFNTE